MTLEYITIGLTNRKMELCTINTSEKIMKQKFPLHKVFVVICYMSIKQNLYIYENCGCV
jgi:hypothetical protein